MPFQFLHLNFILNHAIFKTFFTSQPHRFAPLRGATLAGGRQHLDSDAAHVPVRGDAPSRAPLRWLVLQAARLFDDMLQVLSHLATHLFTVKRRVGLKECSVYYVIRIYDIIYIIYIINILYYIYISYLYYIYIISILYLYYIYIISILYLYSFYLSIYLSIYLTIYLSIYQGAKSRGRGWKWDSNTLSGV